MARKTSKRVWYISLLLLLALATYGLLQSALFNVRQITVEGNVAAQSKDLEDLANIGLGTNIFKVSTADAIKNVLLHPYIQSAVVNRSLPNTLVIKVIERKPLAMLPVANGFVKVDRQGIFLERLETWPKDVLPLISGIKLPPELNLGQPITNAGLGEGLELISELPQELYPMVGELFAGNRDRLVMYTRDGLEIRLGAADSASQKFSVLKGFLQDKNYTPYRAGYYLDLSTGKPVLGKM